MSVDCAISIPFERYHRPPQTPQAIASFDGEHWDCGVISKICLVFIFFIFPSEQYPGMPNRAMASARLLKVRPI
jgi:hypothetical protein